MEKKISVIIPCYNATKWLPKCFLSLVQQTMGMDCMELLFVNDASTDDGETWTMLCEMEAAYPQSIAIINLEENMRQGGARNQALQYATGEYIAFVDADDFVEPDWLEKVYARAKQNDADIVQFNYHYYFEQVGVVENKKDYVEEDIVIHNSSERKNMLMAEKITYGCWNKIYRKSLVEQVGSKYAEHVIYEEPLFTYPLLFYANRFSIMNDHFYRYRQNTGGTMRNDMKAKETLLQHAAVQLAVWEFMKTKDVFKEYYEEIKLYFLHTYLYEILDFAKQRGMELDYGMYEALTKVARKEVEDISSSPYAVMIPKQMELYRLIEGGLSKSDYERYIKHLE